MPRRTKRRGAALLLFASAAVLAAAGFFFRSQSLSAARTYEQEAAITPAPTLAPPMLFAKPTDALLRSGSIGPEVRQMQERLMALGFYQGDLDGQYGGGTKAAVVLFQQQHGLNPDGMAGDETLERLYSEQARQLTVTPVPALPAAQGPPPLLINRTNAVAEGSQPADLVALKDVVPDGLVILKDPDVRAARPAVDALVTMIRAAKAAGLDTWQVSEGYRTYARQRELFDSQVRTYMEDDELSEASARKAAEQTVALPGTSEHHSGLAFDLTVPGYFFGDTPQALWLEEHCWEYGFILRYTANKEDITGFLPEPWHVRYVGTAHSLFMRDHDLALEEYLKLY